MEFFREFGLYFACMLAGFTTGITYAYHQYEKWSFKQTKDIWEKSDKKGNTDANNLMTIEKFKD